VLVGAVCRFGGVFVIRRRRTKIFTGGFGFVFDHFSLTLEAGFRTEAAGPFYYSQQTGHGKNLGAAAVFFLRPAIRRWSRTRTISFIRCSRASATARNGAGRFFQLISFSGGQEPNDADKSRFTHFPDLFSAALAGHKPENYTALVPFYGRLKNRLMRDEIYFVMFPIYSETRKRGVVTDNYLYPFGHLRHGDGLHGWQVWPLAGTSTRT
jgi:hypothetical protein